MPVLKRVHCSVRAGCCVPDCLADRLPARCVCFCRVPSSALLAQLAQVQALSSRSQLEDVFDDDRGAATLSFTPVAGSSTGNMNIQV